MSGSTPSTRRCPTGAARCRLAARDSLDARRRPAARRRPDARRHLDARGSLPARLLTAISLLTLFTLLATAAVPVAASAQVSSFEPCSHVKGFSCATLPVPLDRQAALPGTITLHLARRLAGSTPSKDAVIGLAGGPGQAALPFAKEMAGLVSPALGARDLIVFDQRGTGESGPLHCKALYTTSRPETAMNVIERCADEIGAGRSGYSTAESVADIEAIREALGYEKLVLYGTSYGTKVAEQYAETYPSHVEALVLDSVVPASGNEPFMRPTFEAVGRVLSEICSRKACEHITAKPVAEIARLAKQLRKHPLMGHIHVGSRRVLYGIGEESLFELLLDGDLNPALRAMVPADVRDALHREPDPLLTLAALAAGEIPAVPRHAKKAPEQVDETLFLDTSCEDTPFPWQRTASPPKRLTEAFHALAAIPSDAFAPFEAATAARAGFVGACAYWPYTTAATAASGPLPDVPTLILSGAQDLRTPTANARALAAQIPDSQLLVVPYTGHSVLGSDLSDCAAKAVSAFFAGGTVQPCATSHNPFPPTPVPPISLASVPHEQGVAGKTGRTLRAVLETVASFDSEVVAAGLEAGSILPAGTRFGGLRGGYVTIGAKSLRFHGYSLVPGVELTGTQRIRHHKALPGDVRIGGSAADSGYVRLGDATRVSGELGGKRFSVALHKPASAAAAHAGSAWPYLPGGGLRGISSPNLARVPLGPRPG